MPLQNSGTGRGGEHDSWDQHSSLFSFLENIPREASEVQSALATSDQGVLKSMRDQEAK